MKAAAFDWADRGISSVEEAEDYLNRFENEYAKIMQALGMKGRDPTKPEINFIETWMNDFGFSLELIIEACSKAIINKGSGDFRYANGILENWKKDNITTLEEVEILEAEYYNKMELEKQKKPKQTKKKPKTDEDSESESDYKDLEAIEWELLQKKARD